MSASRGRSKGRGARRRLSSWISRRRVRSRAFARSRTLPSPRLGGLAFEALEDRRLLAIAAAIPPGISNGLDFLLSVTPDNIKDVIPDEITSFPGTSFAYQAFPQEVNDVTIDGNAFNFFLYHGEMALGRVGKKRIIRENRDLRHNFGRGQESWLFHYPLSRRLEALKNVGFGPLFFACL